MLPISIRSNLDRLVGSIQRYIALSGRTVAEVVDRKARSLGIRLFGAFRERQWGGARRRRGVALEELRARSAQGKGILVRPSIMAESDAQRRNIGTLRLGLFAKVGGARAKQLRQLSAQDRKQLRSLQRARGNLWRDAVRRELKARERGIGVLAASFLWYRRRSNSQGTTYVRNRTGESLGYLESAEGFARIVAETPGIARVGDRYGIVPAAIDAERADTDDFVRRRFLGIFQEAQGGAAA
jgi:hypothetical protein